MQHFDPSLLEEANGILDANPELRRLADAAGVEVAGRSLGQEPDVDNATELPYWHRLKSEIRLLLCTEDQKYNELRHRMKQTRGATERVGIPTIAAAIAHTVNLEVALITPFVSLLMISIGQVGIGAWCAGGKEKEQQEPPSADGEKAASPPT